MRKERPPSNRNLPAAWSSLPPAPAIPARTEPRVASTERKPQSPTPIANRQNARILLVPATRYGFHGNWIRSKLDSLGRSDETCRDALGFERDFAVGLGNLWGSQA